VIEEVKILKLYKMGDVLQNKDALDQVKTAAVKTSPQAKNSVYVKQKNREKI